MILDKLSTVFWGKEKSLFELDIVEEPASIADLTEQLKDIKDPQEIYRAGMHGYITVLLTVLQQIQQLAEETNNKDFLKILEEGRKTAGDALLAIAQKAGVPQETIESIVKKSSTPKKDPKKKKD